MENNNIYELFEETKQLIETKFAELKNETSNEPAQPIINVDLSKIEHKIDQNYTQIMEVVSKPQITIHQVDKNTFKPLISLLALGLMFIISLSFNVSQYSDNLKLEDNDIKYRLIKLEGGIRASRLDSLEDIFTYNPDKLSQDKITKDVIAAERSIQERAELLERAERKEQESQDLLNEAEQITP